MSQKRSMKTDRPRSEFESLPDEQQMSIVREFLLFLKENGKWWLLPIIVVISLLGLLVVLSSTGAAPFIYTLF